jgi:hypothetical protein
MSIPLHRCVQIEGTRSPRQLNFLSWCLIFVGVSMELPSCHPSGTYNFELALDFWKIC